MNPHTTCMKINYLYFVKKHKEPNKTSYFWAIWTPWKKMPQLSVPKVITNFFNSKGSGTLFFDNLCQGVNRGSTGWQLEKMTAKSCFWHSWAQFLKFTQFIDFQFIKFNQKRGNLKSYRHRQIGNGVSLDTHCHIAWGDFTDDLHPKIGRKMNLASPTPFRAIF